MMPVMDTTSQTARKKHYTATVWREDTWFIAQCLEVDVASQGKTKAEAVENLRQALLLWLEDPVATVAPERVTIDIDVAATP